MRGKGSSGNGVFDLGIHLIFDLGLKEQKSLSLMSTNLLVFQVLTVSGKIRIFGATVSEGKDEGLSNFVFNI